MNILFHPAAVHLPLGLAFILPLVAAAVLWRFPRAWGLVILLLGVQVASCHLALFTGERIEDAFETVRGKQTKPAIHEHEELAEGLLLASWLGFGLAVGGLLVPQRYRTALRIGTLVLTLASGVQAARTGHAGGTLVYGPDYAIPGAPSQASSSHQQNPDDPELPTDTE